MCVILNNTWYFIISQDWLWWCFNWHFIKYVWLVCLISFYVWYSQMVETLMSHKFPPKKWVYCCNQSGGEGEREQYDISKHIAGLNWNHVTLAWQNFSFLSLWKVWLVHWFIHSSPTVVFYPIRRMSEMFSAFHRKGDRLMQINGVTLQDIIPEELAEMLAQGNPMLVSSWTSTRPRGKGKIHHWLVLMATHY